VKAKGGIPEESNSPLLVLGYHCPKTAAYPKWGIKEAWHYLALPQDLGLETRDFLAYVNRSYWCALGRTCRRAEEQVFVCKLDQEADVL